MKPDPIMPDIGTQYRKILDRLLDAKGQWVNKQVFIREMYLTQAGMVIWNLENKFHWEIEHREFKDIWGFKADHIKPFAYFPKLRYLVSNGRTLCKECHMKTDTWGGRSQKTYEK